MANGEEDLIEKNKGRRKPKDYYGYSKWNIKFGHEDAQILMEKSFDKRYSKINSEDDY